MNKFHAISWPEAVSTLGSNEISGLSESAAVSKLKEDGRNTFENVRSTSSLRIFLRQFSNFFVVLLVFAAIISYFIDGAIQAGVLAFVVLANVSLGFFQENKAEKSLAELKKSYQSHSKVIRNGNLKNIDSDLLVKGDIILLEAGDKVPADLRVIEEESCRVNESALTGESLPISKTVDSFPLETALADRRNILFGSTILTNGRAKGVVIATGKQTEFGKIARLVKMTDEKTPLEKQILYLGKTLTTIAFVIVLVIFGLGYLRGFETFSLLAFTIALLVAAVPESLPTVVTLSLAIGISRMADKKAIVRRMAVVETLGTTNIIATDKTGTLTENKLSIDIISTYNGGKFVRSDLAKSDTAEANKAKNLIADALLCSNVMKSDLEEKVGDPVEIAIAESAAKFGKTILKLADASEREMEVPFDSDKKYMAVLVKQEEGKKLIVKGSTENILSLCKLTKESRKEIEKELNSLSALGYKVLGVAEKNIYKNTDEELIDLNFIGFLAMIDPPSLGIKEALEATIQAGIRPIILTGDHPETARYVANKIGLDVSGDEIITGVQFEKLTALELKNALSKVKIFARITPEDKIKIVSNLQKQGYSVAVTGDGINDAPALKEAEAGIAMGIKGTDIAKESADIVLLDDRYSTIISAVEYGRSIYDNLKSVVTFFLAGNFDELFLIGFAFLFGLPSPLTTLQILWINMVSDSIPALSMAFERPSRKVLLELPRPANAASLKGNVFYAIYLGAVSFSFSLALFLFGLNHSIEKARTFVFLYAVLAQFAFVFSIRSKERFWVNPKAFFENKYLNLAIIISLFLQLILFAKPFAPIFGIIPLSLGEIVFTALLAVISFFVAEILRFYHEKNKKANSQVK